MQSCTKKKKTAIRDAKKYFLDNGYEPYFEDYSSYQNEKLLGVTKEGYKIVSTLHSLNRKHKPEIFSKINPHTIENIKTWLKLNYSAYELLSVEFKNAGEDKLKWLCPTHGEFEMIWAGMYSGKGCEKCAIERRCGDSNCNYNPTLTDEERELKRKILGENINVWRRSVYKRDSYTCQCCGDNKGHNLESHHLDGYNWAKDKRIDIGNGITLCEDCHKNFHSDYGYGNNTKEQYLQFKGNYIK